jgi:integrase
MITPFPLAHIGSTRLEAFSVASSRPRCAGIHPVVVSERLGHATVSIALDTYSHAIPARQEEALLIAGLAFALK